MNGEYTTRPPPPQIRVHLRSSAVERPVQAGHGKPARVDARHRARGRHGHCGGRAVGDGDAQGGELRVVHIGGGLQALDQRAPGRLHHGPRRVLVLRGRLRRIPLRPVRRVQGVPDRRRRVDADPIAQRQPELRAVTVGLRQEVRPPGVEVGIRCGEVGWHGGFVFSCSMASPHEAGRKKYIRRGRRRRRESNGLLA